MATPEIRIERGLPDDEELAAVLAVLTGVLRQRPARPAPARAVWCLESRGVRRPAVVARPADRHLRLVAHVPGWDAVERPRSGSRRTREQPAVRPGVAA